MQDRFEEGEVAALAKKAGLEITPIDEHFADLSKLGHSSLRHYAIYLLERLLATADEALIAAACTPSKKEEQAFFPTFSMGQLLLKNARYFPGMTLTVSPNPLEQIRSTAETLVKEFPSLKKLNKEMEAEEAALQKRLDGIRKEAEKVKGGEDRVEEIIAANLYTGPVRRARARLAPLPRRSPSRPPRADVRQVQWRPPRPAVGERLPAQPDA